MPPKGKNKKTGSKESGKEGEKAKGGDNKQDVASASFFIIMLVCFVYGASSSGLTLTNKKVYAIFGNVSPLNLLMIQCLVNVIICLLLMTIKEMSKSAFHSWIKFGIIIPELSKVSEKAELGLKVGLANLTTVFFGLYSVKYVTIPL